MIIVTGGAGFVGSNLVKTLNSKGYKDILVVDNISQDEKYKNLLALDIEEYVHKNDFREAVLNGCYEDASIEAVFHIGACSNTMEYNGQYMMANNYAYSKELLNLCLRRRIPFIYASSASVYGNGHKGFAENSNCEEALNVYAFSKLLFDRYVERILPTAKSQVVGLRFFNVYGPQENHKGKMASIVYQLYHQVKKDGVIRLFKGIDGYADGEQKRDFVYVKDVVNMNMFFFENPTKSGIFNCGTGKARSFNDVANALIKAVGQGRIEYVEFPEVLKGKYQSFTQADMAKAKSMGYGIKPYELEDAVADYTKYLDENDGYLPRD